MNRILAAALVTLSVVLAGCGRDGGGPSPTGRPFPSPTCGGLKILLEGALPCDSVAEIAVAALAELAPDQLARGIATVDVVLTTCPRNEVPPQTAAASSSPSW